ncbi:winged helix-turn-helix transcriptional regulator [Patescibacteria group bacterium]|nr:winged helix-turn-helix transcriptional regulator [Patescibacteria group bacterium]MBU4142285.1 winged helix-turn-helix transcriptional regulator [Patescibacteria group bacterium]MBU4369105.1 winged helix-turn-helix transcriptional regulator [Patescibacteria group bacterium]
MESPTRFTDLMSKLNFVPSTLDRHLKIAEKSELVDKYYDKIERGVKYRLTKIGEELSVLIKNENNFIENFLREHS